MLVVFVIDTLALAALFRFLSGRRDAVAAHVDRLAPRSAALTVLQLLGGLVITAPARTRCSRRSRSSSRCCCGSGSPASSSSSRRAGSPSRRSTRTRASAWSRPSSSSRRSARREQRALVTAAHVRVREAEQELADANWFERIPARRRLTRARGRAVARRRPRSSPRGGEAATSEGSRRIEGMPSAKPLRVASVNVNGIRAAFRTRHGRVARRPRRRHPRHAGGARLHRRPAGAARRRVGHPARPAPRRRAAPASRSRAATGRASTASSSARPTSTARGAGSRPTTRSAAACVTVVSAYVHSGEADTPKQVEKYRFLDAMEARLPELARALRARARRRRPQRRAPHARHPQLEGQREAGRLPARRARLLRPLRRRRGRRRLQPRRRASAGSTSVAASPARSTARTRGGRGAARRSTTTPDGASTTSSRRPRWPTPPSRTRSTAQRPTTRAGPTTPPSSSTTPSDSPADKDSDRMNADPSRRLLRHAAVERLAPPRQLHRRARHWARPAGRRTTPIYCVVDLHAITVPQDPAELRANDAPHRRAVHRGRHRPRPVDPLRAVARARARRAGVGARHASPASARPSRMTQFKDKSAKQGTDATTVGLFTYPVLHGGRHPALRHRARARRRRPAAAPRAHARPRRAVQLPVRRDVRGARGR